MEKYFFGFTKIEDNEYYTKIFFEIRRQKYLEALDLKDRAKAVEILMKDLKVFSTIDEELFQETSKILTLKDFRENEQLSEYGDTKSARSNLLRTLQELILANPLFSDKFKFPLLKASSLRNLVSSTRQHQRCNNSEPNPQTLFTDHMRPVTRPIVPIAQVARPAPSTPFIQAWLSPVPSNAAHNTVEGRLTVSGMPVSPTYAAPSFNADANALGMWTKDCPASSYQASIPKRPRIGMVNYQNRYNVQPFKRLHSIHEAFHPKDNNIVAVGMDDLATHIYNVRSQKKAKLEGEATKETRTRNHKHFCVRSVLLQPPLGGQNRIASLTFSTKLHILVSSDDDVKLCTWKIDIWANRQSVTLQLPSGEVSNSDTHVQFHSDQLHLLVCHEAQPAIYDASKMECIRQWVPQNGQPAPISFTAYSCNSLLVYAAFHDGNIGVFYAETLRLRCHISPSAYISLAVPTRQPHPAYPLVLATHPHETDGSVKVIEPSESDGKWGSASASIAAQVIDINI